MLTDSTTAVASRHSEEVERIRVIDLVSCIQVVAEEVEEQEVRRLGKKPDRNGYTARIVEPLIRQSTRQSYMRGCRGG